MFRPFQNNFSKLTLELWSECHWNILSEIRVCLVLTVNWLVVCLVFAWLPAGAPCEAILKTGPRMLWWNEEPIPSVETAALYKLVDGQDPTFANAMLQRLADSFRTGNNFTRLCILKAFLLVSKNSGRRELGGTGLFKKERIANHQEVLKRVKSVMDSGDVVARALALRMLGCLGEIAADSVDVHRLVIEALESPHSKEVRSL